MYILILECNDIVKVKSLTKDDLRSADDGLMSIIDCDTEKSYCDGEWVDIVEYIQK